MEKFTEELLFFFGLLSLFNDCYVGSVTSCLCGLSSTSLRFSYSFSAYANSALKAIRSLLLHSRKLRIRLHQLLNISLRIARLINCQNMSHIKPTYPKSSLHFLKIKVNILALELPNRQCVRIYPIPDIITSQILFIE